LPIILSQHGGAPHASPTTTIVSKTRREFHPSSHLLDELGTAATSRYGCRCVASGRIDGTLHDLLAPGRSRLRHSRVPHPRPGSRGLDVAYRHRRKRRRCERPWVSPLPVTQPVDVIILDIAVPLPLPPEWAARRGRVGGQREWQAPRAQPRYEVTQPGRTRAGRRRRSGRPILPRTATARQSPESHVLQRVRRPPALTWRYERHRGGSGCWANWPDTRWTWPGTCPAIDARVADTAIFLTERARPTGATPGTPAPPAAKWDWTLSARGRPAGPGHRPTSAPARRDPPPTRDRERLLRALTADITCSRRATGPGSGSRSADTPARPTRSPPTGRYRPITGRLSDQPRASAHIIVAYRDSGWRPTRALPTPRPHGGRPGGSRRR
jgi:hypothetical protein